MTNHMWSTLALTVTNDVYDSLPEEYQKAVSEAAREASQLAFEEGKQAEAEDIEYCKGGEWCSMRCLRKKPMKWQTS